MLGKTAGGLYWMSRYMERAENIARLIETGQRIALTRTGNTDEDWVSVLQSAGGLDAFKAAGHKPGKTAALNWMLRDQDNPSSVRSCIDAARQNARLVRTAITGEVWEATNETYFATRDALSGNVPERDVPKVLGMIRRNAALVRGMVHGTMMRSDRYDFLRLGTFIERADNTARILDVKYYVLLPTASWVGTSIDNVQWESILRSVSARGGFRMEYGASGGPQEIAHFLILDKRMPRSLAFCVSKLKTNLRYLNEDGGEETASQAIVAEIEAGHLSKQVSEIIEYGLHEFIQETLDKLGRLARQIEIDYRFYE